MTLTTTCTTLWIYSTLYKRLHTAVKTEPHIQNRINVSLVPFTHCWFSNNSSWKAGNLSWCWRQD